MFDVASVKPAVVPSGMILGSDGRRGIQKGSGVQIARNTGGPGTDDPGRIRYPLITLKELLKKGWDAYYEIDGSAWLDTQVVAVEATMPPDTTPQQFQEMPRNLIVERFGLKFHDATKQVAAYTLTLGKSGLKLKESAKQDEAVATGPLERPKKGPDGFLIRPPRPGPWLMIEGAGDRSRMTGQQQTMQELAQALSRLLNSTVTDGAGLTARYDFTLTYEGGIEPGGAAFSPPSSSADAGEPQPNIFGAVQAQLGLKLEKGTMGVRVMAIDRMEKTPLGN
jgi:uncharacterized protein (TIGR03435 family)